MENITKNLVDSDEYPATTEVHTKCISMIAQLWHAADAEDAVGTATTGSSEAIQLGGLAAKKMWQKRMKAKGKDIHSMCAYRSDSVARSDARLLLIRPWSCQYKTIYGISETSLTSYSV